MPKLVKIESNSSVSNYTPASGHVTAFLAEESGTLKLKVKKSDGTISELSGGGVDTSDATAAAADILYPKTAYGSSGTKLTGSIQSKSAATYTPTTSNQTIAAKQYLSGVQTIKGDANLLAANIKSGISIFGVAGSYSGVGVWDIVKVTAYTPASGGNSMVLTGVKATGYSAGYLSFGSTPANYTSFETTPQVGHVYAATGTALLVEVPLIYTVSIPADGMFFYAPLDAEHAMAETGQTLNVYGTVLYEDGAAVFTRDGYAMISFDLGNATPLGTAPTSVSLWCKPSVGITSTAMPMFLFGSTPFDNTTFSLVMGGGYISLHGWGNGSKEVCAGGYAANEEIHIVAMKNNNFGWIYINGKLVAHGCTPINITGTSGSIGGSYWETSSRELRGSIRAVRAYNRMLTPSEIAALAAEFQE